MQVFHTYMIRTFFIFSILFLISKNIDAKEDNSLNTKYFPLQFSSMIIILPYYDKGIVYYGLEKINKYIEGEIDTQPTVSDYTGLKIGGVTKKNITEINAYIKENGSTPINVKTLQQLVNKGIGKISETAIVRYAKGLTSTPPSLSDYQKIAIRCVDTSNLALVNRALRGETFYDVKDTYFIQQSVYSAIGAKNIILDNDAFDPDWVIMLATTMGLEHSCEIHTLGVVTTGRDLNRRQSMSYSAIMHYYNAQYIPIGLNVRQTMRSYYLDATSSNPGHQKYTGGHSNIDEFPSHQCLDYEICPGMNESNGMLCALLTQAKEKVSWVIGGHMHNIANFLQETQQCNGKELFAQKVKQVVITTGWTSRTSGDPEMNFSEGTSSQTSASDATKYFFANRPLNVPVIITSIPNAGTGDPRVGDIFLRDGFQDSPMAFILSVPRYGVYGDHGLSDTDALLYAVREGKTKDGTEYAVPIETCFHVNSYGAVTVGGSCGKPDYYLEMTRSDYARILESEVYNLINFYPQQ